MTKQLKHFFNTEALLMKVSIAKTLNERVIYGVFMQSLPYPLHYYWAGQ